MILQPYIYKFRTCNNFSIDAYIKNEIWASVPSEFNDELDSLLFIDESRVEEEIIKLGRKYFDPNKPLEDARKIVLDSLKNISNVRDFYYVACFSTTYKKSRMWKKYTENGTGFALKYKTDSISQIAYSYPKEFDQPTYPGQFDKLKYSNKRIEATNIAIWILNETIRLKRPITSDDLLPISTEISDLVKKNIFQKTRKWYKEKEIRLSVTNYPKLFGVKADRYSRIGNCKPEALYLGYNISNNNKKILIEHARTLCIPVYQLYIQNVNGNQQLLEKKIL